MRTACCDIETLGLEPFSYRVVAIGFKDGAEEIIFSGDNEVELLQKFWEEQKKYQRLVGWNIDNFDIPFLRIRSLKHNIKIEEIDYKIVDLMRVVSDPMKWTSLDKMSQFLDLGQKEIGGSKIPELIDQKKWVEIKEYFEKDLRLTWEVYQRMKAIGMVR